MSEKIPVIAFLGPPGSGKDTQANFLTSDFGFYQISSGDILRDMRKRAESEPDNFEARAVKDILDRGKYAPTLTIACQWYHILMRLTRRINSGFADKLRGVLFSGSPRKLAEAWLIDDFFSTFPGASVFDFKAVFLDVPESEAMRRLASRRICVGCSKIYSGTGEDLFIKLCSGCGLELKPRHDDDAELARSRMQEYKKYVLPTVEFFKEKGSLVRIDGTQSILKVKADLLQAAGIKVIGIKPNTI